MWRKAICLICGLLLSGGIVLGEGIARFKVTGGKAILGMETPVSIIIVKAPEGVKALEGILILKGAPGEVKDIRSPYGVQVIQRSPRSLRFRWLDPKNVVGPQAADVELLTILIVPSKTGTIQLNLSIPFFITDRGAASGVEVENGVLTVLENTPPVASDDAVSTPEDTPVAIPVLANDSDPEGNLDPSSLEIGVPPGNGAVEVERDTGEVIYTPKADFNGTDSFSYCICDTKGLCSKARVTITVEPVNDPPKAADDVATTEEGRPVTIEILANDSDVDSEIAPSTVTVVSPPRNGSVQVREDGTVIYIPKEGFAGRDAFQYTVRDESGLVSNVATVTVEVKKVISSFQVVGTCCAIGQPGQVVLRFIPGKTGLARIEFTLKIRDPELVDLTGFVWEGLESDLWELSREGAGAWKVRLADLFDRIGPSTGAQRLMIYLSPKSLGHTELVMSSIQGLDDRGYSFSIPGITFPIACTLPPLDVQWREPRDLDGDGKFEDLDGDGRLTLHDALILAFYYDRPPLKLVPRAVDFDGDGTLSFADAEALAKLAFHGPVK